MLPRMAVWQLVSYVRLEGGGVRRAQGIHWGHVKGRQQTDLGTSLGLDKSTGERHRLLFHWWVQGSS